ncbi:MAG: hypothetical protein PVG89_17970 [Gammaproteobacteria bacterium]|jgi:hypothetical protein
MKFSLLVAFALLAFVSSASASFYSGSFDRSSAVVASVEVEGKGIYNLVVSLEFMGKPKDKKIFSSDEYTELIKRLNIEGKGVALRAILSSNTLKITDLEGLEKSIEQGINKLIEKLKPTYDISSSTEVVFSISSFYLMEPHN